jgi:hypothetical protein
MGVWEYRKFYNLLFDISLNLFGFLGFIFGNIFGGSWNSDSCLRRFLDIIIFDCSECSEYAEYAECADFRFLLLFRNFLNFVIFRKFSRMIYSFTTFHISSFPYYLVSRNATDLQLFGVSDNRWYFQYLLFSNFHYFHMVGRWIIFDDDVFFFPKYLLSFHNLQIYKSDLRYLLSFQISIFTVVQKKTFSVSDEMVFQKCEARSFEGCVYIVLESARLALLLQIVAINLSYKL